MAKTKEKKKVTLNHLNGSVVKLTNGGVDGDYRIWFGCGRPVTEGGLVTDITMTPALINLTLKDGVVTKHSFPKSVGNEWVTFVAYQSEATCAEGIMKDLEKAVVAEGELLATNMQAAKKLSYLPKPIPGFAVWQTSKQLKLSHAVERNNHNIRMLQDISYTYEAMLKAKCSYAQLESFIQSKLKTKR